MVGLLHFNMTQTPREWVKLKEGAFLQNLPQLQKKKKSLVFKSVLDVYINLTLNPAASCICIGNVMVFAYLNMLTPARTLVQDRV